jgi:protein-disulfide isomerase
MNRKVILGVILSTVIIVGVGIFLASPSKSPPGPSKYDDFAKCLSQKGAVMYGSYSCSHCQKQKDDFAGAFQYVNYVECTTQTERCVQANIEGYPTWIFSDGTRLRGEQSFENLAKASSCQLPQ